MTPPYESVEIVEVTWKIPNFGRYIPSGTSGLSYKTFRKVVFIGGRVPTAYPQSKSPPVKLEVSVYKQRQITPSMSLGDGETRTSKWLLRFVVISDLPQPPSPCCLQGKLMELKTLDCERTLIKAMKNGETTSMEFSTRHHEVILFDHSDAGGYMDKSDESLNINFKLEITCSLPEPIRREMMTGEFTALSNDFESLLQDPENADVEIVVSVEEEEESESEEEEEDKEEGQSFQCHKMILAVRSPVFHAMFASAMKKTGRYVVKVNNILPKTMEHFLSFLYCGRFPDSSWIQYLPQLAYAADKYEVESLEDLCDTHLIRCVTLKNALTLGTIAEKHGYTDATKDIRNFICENAHGVTLNCNVDIDPSKCDPDFNVTYTIP